jgi:hypothetical protein
MNVNTNNPSNAFTVNKDGSTTIVGALTGNSTATFGGAGADSGTLTVTSGDVVLSSTYQLRTNVTDGYLRISGADADTTGSGGLINMFGVAHAQTGAITVYTPDAAGTADTLRITLTGKAATATMTLAATTLALGANNLTMTGTISATGARVTQSYHTNITSTNAVTVDSSETVKDILGKYAGRALGLIRKMDVITFKHDAWLDPSGAVKLGIRAESVDEPLAITQIDREDGRTYPGLNLYAHAAMLTKAVQALTEAILGATSLADLKRQVALA